jgi:hypothetical protein
MAVLLPLWLIPVLGVIMGNGGLDFLAQEVSR